MQARDLEPMIRQSPLLGLILDRWAQLELPDCWLGGGAIAQTTWNRIFQRPPTHGISDIDIVYFDPRDMSEETEAKHANRIRVAFSELPVRIDVKNEARVHLWYNEKFGYSIAPYVSVQCAIATFPTTATCVGVQPSGSELLVCAPHGLTDLFSGIVRPNKTRSRAKSTKPRRRVGGWFGRSFRSRNGTR